MGNDNSGQAPGRPKGLDLTTPCKVLLVDDDSASRMSTALILEDLGYVVISAASAEEAMKRLAAEPDVLLTDINLDKGQRGDVLAREMLENVPNLAVAFMSGLGVDAGVTAATGDGPTVVLAKPFEREELDRAIRQALGGKRLA